MHQPAIFVLIPGRPIGLHPQNSPTSKYIFTTSLTGQWRQWIEKALTMALGFIHLHSQVDQDRWVSEFSQYDAGWLHFFRSENGGNSPRPLG